MAIHRLLKKFPSGLDKNVLHKFGLKQAEKRVREMSNANKRNSIPASKHQDLVTIEFAANYYSVCKKTVRNWISQGRLQGYELADRLIRIDYEEMRNLPMPINGTYKKGSN